MISSIGTHRRRLVAGSVAVVVAAAVAFVVAALILACVTVFSSLILLIFINIISSIRARSIVHNRSSNRIIVRIRSRTITCFVINSKMIIFL